MIVVIAKNIPSAVRGKMKLWFIEPKPNVFISGIKDSVANTVIDLLLKYCPFEADLIIFKKINQPPFFKIYQKGVSAGKICTISGMQLFHN